jgi:hypothetical protein
MLYNQGISDQIIRLQMETLENKLGYLSAKLGNVDYVMMDGTLTGSLTRPPVYPESVKGLTTIENALGKDRLKELVREFVGLLDDHYRELEDELGENGKVNGNVILADEELEEFEEFYRAMEGYPVRDFAGTTPRMIKRFRATIDDYLKGKRAPRRFFKNSLTNTVRKGSFPSTTRGTLSTSFWATSSTFTLLKGC